VTSPKVSVILFYSKTSFHCWKLFKKCTSNCQYFSCTHFL